MAWDEIGGEIASGFGSAFGGGDGGGGGGGYLSGDPYATNEAMSQSAGFLDMLLAMGKFGMGVYATSKMGAAPSMGPRVWGEMRPVVQSSMQNMFSAPWLQGVRTPYSGQEQYGIWQPGQMSPSMTALRQNYLERTYGMPQGIARSMVAQTQSPLRINRQMLQGMTPGQAGLATQLGPQQYAQAGIGTQLPQYLGQRDYLRGAAEISAYNLYRAQQLGELIA